MIWKKVEVSQNVRAAGQQILLLNSMLYLYSLQVTFIGSKQLRTVNSDTTHYSN